MHCVAAKGILSPHNGMNLYRGCQHSCMTDPYIPLEKELCMTRRALEPALQYGFGFTLQTKSDLVLHDNGRIFQYLGEFEVKTLNSSSVCSDRKALHEKRSFPVFCPKFCPVEDF